MLKAYALFVACKTPQLGRTLAYANAIQAAYIKYAHAIYKKACTNKRVVI